MLTWFTDGYMRHQEEMSYIHVMMTNVPWWQMALPGVKELIQLMRQSEVSDDLNGSFKAFPKPSPTHFRPDSWKRNSENMIQCTKCYLNKLLLMILLSKWDVYIQHLYMSICICSIMKPTLQLPEFIFLVFMSCKISQTVIQHINARSKVPRQNKNDKRVDILS